jgi:hypothetical protein
MPGRVNTSDAEIDAQGFAGVRLCTCALIHHDSVVRCIVLAASANHAMMRAMRLMPCPTAYDTVKPASCMPVVAPDKPPLCCSFVLVKQFSSPPDGSVRDARHASYQTSPSSGSECFQVQCKSARYVLFSLHPQTFHVAVLSAGATPSFVL